MDMEGPCLAGGLVAGLILGLGFGRAYEESRWKAEIMKQNLGEYVIVNKETGTTEFRWKESK